MMVLKSKVLAGFLVFLMVFSLTPAAFGETLETAADTALLMEAETGKILFEKNAHKPVAPASVTKLMTLVVAAEALQLGKVNLTDKVVTSERAYEMGGSQIYLEPGEEMTLNELLIAIAVGSANDACVAVAEHISGSYEAFADEMNRKAKELGCKNTHFVNPHGLPAENHYTSAYDMALIAQYALRLPKVREYSSIKHYTLRTGTDKPFQLDNHNKLLWQYSGADGFKTGWTSEANYCLVSTAERNNLRLIASVFGVPEIRGHFKESIKLFNYGYAKYGYHLVAPKGSVQGSLKVGKGVMEQVDVITPQKVGVLLEKGKEKGIESKALLPEIVNAPIIKGQRLGEIIVSQNGQEIDRVPLVAKNGIDKAPFWDHLKGSLQGILGIQ